MAKGRKLSTNRSERLLGSYGYPHGHGGGGGSDAPDLREEDLWSMVDDGAIDYEERLSGHEWGSRAAVEINSHGAWGGRRREIPSSGGGGGGLSLAVDEYQRTTASPRVVHQFRTQQNGVTAAPQPHGNHHHLMGMATSAPVNVPDWHKILRVDSVESMRDSGSDPAEEESLDSEWVPPHEYLARSRRAAATSVFEGVGRTLKGRDLSRVRDAVWSQTGFDG